MPYKNSTTGSKFKIIAIISNDKNESAYKLSDDKNIICVSMRKNRVAVK